jgi:hypothetical protein
MKVETTNTHFAFGGQRTTTVKTPLEELDADHDCWRHWPRLRRMNSQMMGRLRYLQMKSL